MPSTVKFVIKFSRSLVLLTLVFAMAVMAQAQKNDKKIAAKSEEARKSADVFTSIMNVPDKSIPRDLLSKAEAIAVFPGVVKGGFIIGARGGHGVISRRVKGGWSPPAFFNWAAAVWACSSALQDRFCLALYEYRGAREFDEQQI
jgi:lipid-binding SYLF domain-containing protein